MKDNHITVVCSHPNKGNDEQLEPVVRFIFTHEDEANGHLKFLSTVYDEIRVGAGGHYS